MHLSHGINGFWTGAAGSEGRFSAGGGPPGKSAAIAIGAAPPPPRFARWMSSRRIAAACLATSARTPRSSVTAVRVDARNLVQIPLGPQKPLPASSPLVIIWSTDRGFRRDGLDPLLAETMPKNRDTLEST
jgi:hypothetical protein